MSKVVFITGASSGLGKSIGEFLLQKGFTVYGTSRNPEKFTNLSFPLLALDVRDPLSIASALSQIISRHGRLDVVINNAGVGITGPLEEIPMSEIRNNFETNLFGPIEVIKAVLPKLREQKSGLIINITSIAGYIGLPYRSVYSSSKGALSVLTEGLRMEVKNFGIRIVDVAPGDFVSNIASNRYHSPQMKESDYNLAYEKTLKLMNDHVEKGSRPEEISRIIHQIILTPDPDVHYKVGAFSQRLSIALKRILPDKIFERIIMKHYKL